MKKRLAVVAILIIVVAALVWALYPRDSELQPVSRAEGLKLLAQLRKGADKSKAAMKNGCGKVTMQMRLNIPDEMDFREEATCNVYFAGEGYKIRVIDYYHRNRKPGKPLTQRLKDLGSQIVKPGSVKATPSTGSMNYPGPEMTRGSIYSGNRKAITEYAPRKKHAQVNSTDSMQGYMVYQRLRALIMSRSYYSKFTAYVRKDGPSNNEVKKTGSEPVVLGRQRIDRDDCIVIEQQFSYAYPHMPPGMSFSYKTKFWVCPKKGFHILRSETWGPYPTRKQTSDMLMSVTNTDVREYKPGVWGLVKVNSTGYAVTEKGEPFKQYLYSIAYEPGFQLNVPKSKLDLRLKLPKGTYVNDEVKHRNYTVK